MILRGVGWVTVAAAIVLLWVAPLTSYVLGTAWWAESRVPVHYTINPANDDGLAPSAVIAAIRYGADVWATETAANFRFVYDGTTTITETGFNQQNNVVFSPIAEGNVIARTRSWWLAPGPGKLDSDIIFYDGYAKFFTGATGCSGGWYIEDIAAHEWGHVVGLGHSLASGNPTMKSGIGGCQTFARSLHADDIAGIEFLYPPVGGPDPPPSIGVVRVTD